MDTREWEKARNLAFRYLGFAARSQSEIARRLTRSDIEPAIIEAIIAEMVAAGLLDDEKFAHDWVADRAERKRYGKTRLAQELHQRGVAKELITDALGDLSDDDETRHALAAARPRWNADAYERLDRTARQKERTRLAQFLQRRGFSFSTARRVLDRLVSDRDENDDGL